eukprot:TRINITY_DN3035_c0_g1_i1.p1 TRINITY_DN3035_c0_g1~~TRINITY_DN3035_c0_g1_i1.p1  ORF type:complete len:340 (+),score=95.66 TRINITY_DN3035_c0_g1_i1:368-1387(+)
MYTQEQLQEIDAEVYNWYLKTHDLSSLLFQTLHDYFDFFSNLRQNVCTRTKEELEESLKIIANPIDQDKFKHEFENLTPPRLVLKRFGSPTNVHAPSLGIPTWKYGHEPPNMFATWQAKMFSNAVREDGLIAIGNAGVIFTPGSAGTRQEVFQAACKCHYAPSGEDVPLIFWGEQFWNQSGILDVLIKNSTDRPFARWILSSDDLNAIVNHCVRYRSESKLPVVTLDELKAPHWEKNSGRPTASPSPHAVPMDTSRKSSSGNVHALRKHKKSKRRHDLKKRVMDFNFIKTDVDSVGGYQGNSEDPDERAATFSYGSIAAFAVVAMVVISVAAATVPRKN